MSHEFFEVNIRALAKNQSSLALEITRAESDSSTYSGIKQARTGERVPLGPTGLAYHSVYDPVSEAKKMASSCDGSGFCLISGLAGGFHVREALKQESNEVCIVLEGSLQSLRSLFSLVPLADILENKRVLLVPNAEDLTVAAVIAAHYLPVLHGGFSHIKLRTWVNANDTLSAKIEDNVKKALEAVSADVSVQSHFGKLWFRNFLLNAHLASGYSIRFPDFQNTKRAVITAAGPSLEQHISDLKKDRENTTIFTTDTAYPVLLAHSIFPDYFISIDAQTISSSHSGFAFEKNVKVILDICGNAEIARAAVRGGNPLLLVNGGHPLASYAGRTAYLPQIRSSSGTVTIAALDAAYNAGYTDVRTVGADFAYTNGKPYARGTYLAKHFSTSTSRLNPLETRYTTLMFRSPVTKSGSSGGITYHSELLNRYKTSFMSYKSDSSWDLRALTQFPFASFMSVLKKDLEAMRNSPSRANPAFNTILPLAAWLMKKTPILSGQNLINESINLALDLIAGYNKFR